MHKPYLFIYLFSRRRGGESTSSGNKNNSSPNNNKRTMDKTPSKTAGGDVKKGGSPQSDSGLTAVSAQTTSSTNSGPWLEEEEEEEEDKLIQQRQEGFSEEIKAKTYTGPNAADELGVDLGKCGLLDAYKHIDLNSNGKAYWIEMPNETQFHGVAIEKLGDLALDHCSDDYRLAIKTELAMYMTFRTGDINHPRKYPTWPSGGGRELQRKDGDSSRRK